MRVGPASSMPTWFMRPGAPARAYSSAKITCSARLAPRPPYFSGQPIAPQPASPSARSQARRSSTLPLKLVTPRMDAKGPDSCSSSQAAASARKASCSGVNPVRMSVLLAQLQNPGNGFALRRAVSQQGRAAARALEIQVGVVLPRKADAAVKLDGVARAIQIRVGAIGLGDRRRLRQARVVLVRHAGR